MTEADIKTIEKAAKSIADLYFEQGSMRWYGAKALVFRELSIVARDLKRPLTIEELDLSLGRLRKKLWIRQKIRLLRRLFGVGQRK